MVKPQINIEKKNDLKKPDNVLVKVVTVGEEPAPINPEPTYGPVITVQQRSRHRCVCLFLLMMTFLLLSTMGTMLYFKMHRGGFRCGVGYIDGWDYENYDYFDERYGSSYDNIPFGNDALMPPRPTGPPMERFIDEGVDIQVDLNIVRISNPGDSRSQSVTVLHDFDMNLSAYLLDSSEICYIRPLNKDSTLEPEYFMNLIENGDYQDQQFPMMSEVYGVIPDEVYNLEDVSEHVQSLCAGYSTYYIQKIPTDQWRGFWHTIRSVIHGRRHGDDDGSNGDFEGDHSGRDSSEEGRRHGGRGSHRGGPGGHRGGSSSRDGSSSHSGESRHGRGIMGFREYMNNVRSFDGQQVVDMHIFQTHKLGELSPTDAEQLGRFLKPSQLQDDWVEDDIIID